MSLIENKKKYFPLVLVFFFFSCQSFKENRLDFSAKKQGSSVHSSKEATWSAQKTPVINKDYLEYSASAAYLKAETAFLEGETESALTHLKTAQIFSRDSAYILERKADFYKKEALLTEAVQVYKKRIEKYGQDPRIQKKIMECYVLNGLNDLALKENERLLEKEPESFLLGFQKAVLLIGEERWEESLKVFQLLLSQDQTLEEAAHTLSFQSYVFNQLQREAEALESYQRLLALDFPEESVVLSIGELYRKTGREDWAIDYVLQFQEKQGITKHSAYFLFDAAFAAGDWEQAFRQTESLSALGNLKRPHRFYKAFYLRELGRHDLAISYFKDLLFEDPENGQYQYLLAASYAKSNRTEQALEAYEKVSLSSPFFILSRLDLARLLEERGEHKKALSLLKALAFGDKMSPSGALEYAKSLWRLGERKQALFVLTSALKQAPSNNDLLTLKAGYSEKLAFAESVL